MSFMKLHISVSVDDPTDVKVWSVDVTEEPGEVKQLTEGVHYTLEFVRKRTERCHVCDRTYAPDEVVRRAGERLCLQCDLDKHPEEYPGLY